MSPFYVNVFEMNLNNSKYMNMQKFFFISNGRYIDYLSLTYATNKSRILKVTL